MKKYTLILMVFLACMSGLKAQTYVGVGNTLQRAPTAKGYIYRFSLGAPGFWAVAGQAYVDSLFNLAALKTNTITVNGNTQTLGSNPSFTVTGGVTSITPGVGFTNHTPITSSGTLNIDTVTSHTGLANKDYVLSQVLSNSPTIPAGPISSLPVLAFNPGTNISPGAWIQAVYYQTQVPTAGLSGGSLSEYSTSNKTHNLSWSYGRQSATATISTAVINPGSFNVFGSQPTQPGTISGSQSVTTTANTNTTYTITVTTSDSKVATASSTDSWAPGIYYGRAATTTPTASDILAVAGGAKVIATGHAGSWTVVASGSNHPFIAINNTQGSITLIKDVNGFDVTSSFPVTNVSVTNVNGFTATYNVYTLTTATSSNYPFTTN